MDYKKAKTILRKLNSLLESFENLGEPLSDIETEMLLRYTTEFQKLIPDVEEIDEPIVVQPIKVEKVKPQKKQKKKAAVTKVVKVVEEIVEEEIEEEIIEENVIVEEVIETPEPTTEQEEDDEDFDVPPPKVVAKPTKTTKKSTAAKKVKKALVATEEEVTEDIDLWSKDEFTELSEKLSFSPIKNIFKSISINERIFTQNELFGGDHLAFRSTLELLEEKESFEEAVSFLKNGIAKEQKWESAKKIKKAGQFMKLVQRRFL